MFYRIFFNFIIITLKEIIVVSTFVCQRSLLKIKGMQNPIILNRIKSTIYRHSYLDYV